MSGIVPQTPTSDRDFPRTAFIDAQAFTMQRRGGISRYIAELISRDSLFKLRGWQLSTPYRKVRSSHAAELMPGRFSLVPGQSFALSAMLALLRAYQQRQGRGHLLHHTYYFPQFLTRWQGVRVVTVYDMIPEIYPELFPGGNPHHAKKEFLERADAIIAISQRTKDDVVNIYGLNPARIRVIPLGVRPRDQSQPPFGYSERNSHIVYVGRRKGYKDFDVALDGFAKAHAELPWLQLVVAGGGSFSSGESARIDELQLSDCVRRIDLTDEELRDTFSRALGFVFPSRYEGFGLPALEAMAEGCPVFLADGGSLSEVGGTAATYFPTGDSSALAEGLVRVLDNETAWTSFQQLGFARSEQYSWDGTAAQTAELYSSLV